ncbi:MAG: hypothetical protein R3F43_27450 [bacterium]
MWTPAAARSPRASTMHRRRRGASGARPQAQEKADQAIEQSFGMLEGIPAQVEAKVREAQDPFIRQVRSGVDTLANGASERLGALRGTLDQVKNRILEAADTQISAALEKMDGTADVVAPAMAQGIDVLTEEVQGRLREQARLRRVAPELERHLTDLKEAADRLLRQSLSKASETVTTIKDDAIAAVEATFTDRRHARGPAEEGPRDHRHHPRSHRDRLRRVGDRRAQDRRTSCAI